MTRIKPDIISQSPEMHALALLSTLFVVVNAVSSEVLPRQAPGTIRVNNITYSGSGCSTGSAFPLPPDGGPTFALYFSQFLVQSGPGIPASEASKSCRVDLDLSYPNGYQFAIFETNSRGFISLAAGSTATIKSTYIAKGEFPQVSRPRPPPPTHTAHAYSSQNYETSYAGPIAQDLLKLDKFSKRSLVFSDCQERNFLTITTQLNIKTKPGTQNIIALDAIDGKITNNVTLVFRQC